MDFSIKGTPVRIETENEFVDAIAYANLKRGSDIWTQDIVPWTVQVELGKGQEAYVLHNAYIGYIGGFTF